MRTELPIFRQISLDLDRSSRELQVFWAACELLDVVDERAMTVTALEHVLLQQQRAARLSGQPLSRSTIAHALSKLEGSGYLRCSVGADGRERWRVPLSRAVQTTAAASPPARRRPTSTSGVVSEAVD